MNAGGCFFRGFRGLPSPVFLRFGFNEPDVSSEPSMSPQDGLEDGPKMAPEGPTTAQESSKRPPERLREAKNHVKAMAFL